MKTLQQKAKRPVGRPPTNHRFIGLRCHPDLLERIDKWQARNAPGKSLSMVIKTLVEIGLKHESK